MHVPDSLALEPRIRRALERFDPRPTAGAVVITHLVAWSSWALMQWGNRVTLVHGERLDAARAAPRGLLTFSNHVSLFDDPWLTACLSGAEWSSLRWIAADATNFFGTRWKAAFFGAGKCVPVVRGIGRDQPGMAFLAARLRAGDWVHVFPEGGRSREPGGALQTPLKGGLAQLIQASSPLVLPFFHVGMHEVLPIGARLPRFGNDVHLVFGALRDAADGLASSTASDITAWAEATLHALQIEALDAFGRPGERSAVVA